MRCIINKVRLLCYKQQKPHVKEKNIDAEIEEN